MNYVILNGVKSNTIKGLLIQSLPPISKPLIRTQVEEIDGRDGDIVTALGYSAYDKTMEIGLCGDYNVDDVVQYFDSSGTVTFSNEPDKYYLYQITEQIDFARLIRFKTATVTFHVQPFKYSAVENSFSFSNNVLNVKDYAAAKNGITLTASNGKITVNGTGITATEFYVPIQNQTVSAGNYTLTASASGTNASAASIRLIKSAPSNADSFGGNYLGLQNNATATMSGTVSASTVYGYLWFYIAAGTAMNFTLETTLVIDDFNSVNIFNSGNTVAKPKITLYGSGTVNFSLNGVQIFIIDLGSMEYITIDAAQMNAYQGDIFMNRHVSGDYSDLTFRIGTNALSWTGDVTGIDIDNFSRWI